MERRNTKFMAVAMSIAPMSAVTVYADIVTPAGLSPGDQFNIIFVSADTINAESTDPSVYDQFAQSEAAAAGLDTYNGSSVTWQALGSFDGGPDAISRFDPSNAIYLVNGALVADSGADLWNTSATPLQNAIDIDQNGNIDLTNVWTGSFSNGTESFKPIASPPSLENTGFGDDPANYGFSGDTDDSWVFDGATDNTLDYSIYAVSQTLTVPGAAPLPASAELALAGMGMVGLAAASRRLSKPQAD